MVEDCRKLGFFFLVVVCVFKLGRCVWIEFFGFLCFGYDYVFLWFVLYFLLIKGFSRDVENFGVWLFFWFFFMGYDFGFCFFGCLEFI